MLYGVVIPDSGEVHLGRWQMQHNGPCARASIGVVTQEDNLDTDLSVRENLEYFLCHYRITGKAAKDRALEMLERVGLSSYADYDIDQLSGGLKRRLVLARAMLHHPAFLFLDEPTTGLDPEARQEFWKLILELREEGHAVLLTTHYMEESERLCSRIALMRDGAIVDQDSPQALICRVAGEEVIETAGIAEEAVRMLAGPTAQWFRRIGNNTAFAAPSAELRRFLREVEPLHPTKIIRRPANLDDVFFLLTGEILA